MSAGNVGLFGLAKLLGSDMRSVTKRRPSVNTELEDEFEPQSSNPQDCGNTLPVIPFETLPKPPFELLAQEPEDKII